MNAEQMKLSNSILQGMKYLTDEAERNGVKKIARILKRCGKDICIIMEQEAKRGEELSSLIDTTLVSAAEFLAKYSATKDPEIRRAFISEIKRRGLEIALEEYDVG